jgi:predicted RNA-binding protein with PUA-like domain
MNYWLLKSEPGTWSWDNQKKVKKEMWDGVRNYQARNNLIKMRKGDLCFFYHSVKEKQIVGIVEVTKENYPDPTDKTKKFVVVDVKYRKDLKNPVKLESIKLEKKLSHLSLIKQSRLSVMPIDLKSWNLILKMSNI